MSVRALLILAVLLAAALAALHWLGRSRAPAPPTADAPLVRAFDEPAVRQIDLACSDTPVTLRREAQGAWTVHPIDVPADGRKVHDLLGTLKEARVRKVIEENATDRAAFGLAPPACSARLTLDGQPASVSVEIGRSSPVGSERYASSGSPRVVLVDGSVFTAAARNAEGFREKRLFPVEASELSRITIERPGTRLVLAVENGGCRIEQPIADAGSSSACNGLMRVLTSSELKEPFSTTMPKEVKPERRVQVDVAVKNGPPLPSAYVAAQGVGGKRLAWREGIAQSGLLDEGDARQLDLPVDSFRNPQIESFSSPEVRRLTVEHGSARLEVERTGEAAAWTSPQGPIDGSRVDAVLDTLRGLTASGFEAQLPSAPATATVSIAGEHGELARVSYGPLPKPAGAAADLVWVTTPARPKAVFHLNAEVLSHLPRTVAELAPAPSPSPAPSASPSPGP